MKTIEIPNLRFSSGPMSKYRLIYNNFYGHWFALKWTQDEYGDFTWRYCGKCRTTAKPQ